MSSATTTFLQNTYNTIVSSNLYIILFIFIILVIIGALYRTQKNKISDVEYNAEIV